MAFLNPQEAFHNLRDNFLDSVTRSFPVRGKDLTVHLDQLHVDDKLDPEDVESQLKAKMGGTSWTVPVHGTVSLKDAQGNLIEKRKIKLAELPKMTKRYSYILDGQEYQIANQWQLRPGVYTRRRNNGELESRFNVGGGNAFDLLFEPDSKVFKVSYKKANIPAYPLMKALGATDEELEKTWGKSILDANKVARRAGNAVNQFYQTALGKEPTSPEEALSFLKTNFAKYKMDSEVNDITLGKPIDGVTHETMQLASAKLLKVQAGHPEDDRDSLVFKRLRSSGDYVREQVDRSARLITGKIQRQLNAKDVKGVRDVLTPDLFTRPVRDVFIKSSLSNVAKQINPLEMVSAAMQTTIMGPGGIQNEEAVTSEAKMINPSSMGFIDPICTPEGASTGISLRLPLGVRKDGYSVKMPLHNMKTGKIEYVTPRQFMASKVVFPDQVKFENGKPVPRSAIVKMAGKDNDIIKDDFKNADYVMPDTSQLFNLTSNIVPFLHSCQGNRAGMATRHVEQAISLLHREERNVQAQTPTKIGDVGTFDHLIGKQVAHHSPAAGEVVKIGSDSIHVKAADGEVHDVKIYNHFPLNDTKSMLHAEPVVKVGDKVKSGQLLAETNYTRNGRLALGTHLRSAVLAYRGINYEDGVILSESAAKKMASLHLSKEVFLPQEKTIMDPKVFQVKHQGLFDKYQYANIGTDGVVKVGTKIKPGDPMILATQPYDIKSRTDVAALRKSAAGDYTDRSVRWQGEHEGEVVRVDRDNKGQIHVHVKTIEPMTVGDKISGASGDKGICVSVLPDAHMPHTKDGKPMELLFNPLGVPGRMNPSQLMDLAAGKIAEKTGKTYIVKNFDGSVDDQARKLIGELKQHGLSQTDELIDPITGKSLGQVTTGPKYTFKLVHQIDKKMSVRSGMTLPKMPHQEGYDSTTLQPGQGGHHGGQSFGLLDTWALLAHGSNAILRESQTIKSEVEDPQTDPNKRWKGQHLEVWNAIQSGLPIPTPKPTFTFHKFTQMLHAAGINMEKKGSQLVLSPFTDKHILAMSKGALTDPTKIVESKVDKETNELKPIKGGLFDPKVTGGHGGVAWSHITLAEPVPNPVFERPIKSVLGWKEGEYDDVLNGKRAWNPATKTFVELGRGLTGGEAVKKALASVDVNAELTRTKALLAKTNIEEEVDKLNRKARYLRALNDLKMKPDEAYVLHHMPVLPPSFRPVTLASNNTLKFEDLNGLYAQFAQINAQLGDKTLKASLTDKKLQPIRQQFNESMAAIVGHQTIEQDKPKGVLQQISGNVPKESYIQAKLVQRRQDLTMRSTIVPEPKLGLDEVGIPKSAALDLFLPFVVRKMVQQGVAQNVLDARTKISEHKRLRENPLVMNALKNVMDERPVIMNRAPVLHKWSIQGFKPKLVDGEAIKIHPLTCGAYNADFDGDHQIGRIFVFVAQTTHASQSVAPKATHGGKSSWPGVPWWKSRQVDAEMSRHLFSKTAETRPGCFYVLDLADIPHSDDCISKHGIDFHPAADGVEVISFDECGLKFVVKPITYWSKHAAREVEIVRLHGGKHIITDDDPRAVYGLDPFLNIGRARPKEAKDWYAPSMMLPRPDGVPASFDGLELDERTGRATAMMLMFCSWGRGSLSYKLPTKELHDEFESTLARLHASGSLPTLSWWEEQTGHGEHLPAFFHAACIEYRKGMLGAFMEHAEASRGKNPRLDIAVPTIRVAYELCDLADSLGMRYSINPGKGAAWMFSLMVPGHSDHWPLPSGPRVREFDRLRGTDAPDPDPLPVPPWLKPKDVHLLSEGNIERSKARLIRTWSTEPWKELQAGPSRWLRVKHYIKTGKKEVGYDLVVPGTNTFMSSQGVVLSNTMAVYVPITADAQADAHRMMPSRNLFNETTGKLMYLPTLEYALGLYKLTKKGNDTSHVFKSPADAVKALQDGKIHVNDGIKLGDQKTTAGKVLLASVMPPEMRSHTLSPDTVLDKKGLNGFLEKLANEHRHEFGKIVNDVKDLGADAAFGIIRTHLVPPAPSTHPDAHKHPEARETKGIVTIGAHTLTLDDFIADKQVRDKHMVAADAYAAKMRANTAMPRVEQDRLIAQNYLDTQDKILKEHLATGSMNNEKLRVMFAAGTKPGKEQYPQLSTMVGILTDTKNNLIPVPVDKTHGEGLDTAGYWTSMHGARRGTVRKVQEVRDPGAASKLLQNTCMSTRITEHDCGTPHALPLELGDPDLQGRLLAQPLKLGKQTIPKDTVITPNLVGHIKAHDPDMKHVHVRSPIGCGTDSGICQKCQGLSVDGQFHPLGTNIGIVSAHAIGERSVQLTMKEFHCVIGDTFFLTREQSGEILERSFKDLWAECEGMPVQVDGSEEIIDLGDVGLEVWDRGGWVRVKALRRHPQQAGTKMMLARSANGSFIISQDNHPNMVKRQGQFVPVEPKQLMAFDELVDVEMPSPALREPPIKSGWLAGMYVAEGSIFVRKQKGEDYVVGLSFGQKKGHLRDRLKEAIQKEWPDVDKITETENHLAVYRRDLGLKFLRTFGRYSRNVALPRGWTGYPREWLGDFLAGLLDGDGTIDRGKDAALFYTTSPGLLAQISRLARMLGGSAGPVTTPWREHSKNMGYMSRVYMVPELHACLGASSKAAQVKPRMFKKMAAQPMPYLKEVRYEEPPMVYDLTTASGTYVANGIWTHNTGGVAGATSKASSGFDAFNQLIMLDKKIPDAATVAMSHGKITKIEHGPTGVTVHVNNTPHFIGRDAAGRPLHEPLPNLPKGAKPWSGLKVGDEVKAGTSLSDPNRTTVNPHDLYAATGSIKDVRAHLVGAMYDMYKDEGVRRRTVETVVRCMTNVSKIQDPGDHPHLLKGDHYPTTFLDKLNQTELSGKSPIKHSPVLKGVNMLPFLQTEDWLAKTSHQRLRESIAEGAAMNLGSKLHGNHPMPGIIYGAELGKPELAKHEPGVKPFSF